MDKKYLHFNDFAEEEYSLEGKKRTMEEILNTEILVIRYKIKESKHYKDRNYLTIQFENGGSKYIAFTSSEVLTNQIEKYEEKLPFYTTIRKVNNYYTMT